MKKYQFLFLLVILYFFFCCEKDDFCTKTTPVTPRLILRFYDKADKKTLKKVNLLSVIAKGKKDSLFIGQTTDSIAIPLNTDTKITDYILKMNAVSGDKKDNQYEKIKIQYTTQSIFVSRSCGFKTVFKDVKITSDKGWFQSFTPEILTTIDNEKKAHLKVYF